MKCPLCSVDLVMADRQGIEIDYCPKCRGIWLDRGEIDKIIERSQGFEQRAAEPAALPAAPQPAAYAPPPTQGWAAPPGQGWAPQPHWKRDDDDDDRRKHGQHGYPKKRKGFLSEILDFD